MVANKILPAQEFDTWELEAIIDHIINSHHPYAKATAAIVYNLVQNVSVKHCKNHPELLKLSGEMFLFFHDLLNHMLKEEELLFPNIRQLIKNKHQSRKYGYTTFGLIKELVIDMKKDHQAACTDLRFFHELTNNYELPDDACLSYKFLFEKMKEFEDYFSRHVDLENNILFPKALSEDGEIE